MASSSSLLGTCFRTSTISCYSQLQSEPKNNFQQIGFTKNKCINVVALQKSLHFYCPPGPAFLHNYIVPVASSLALILCSTTPAANAGILSGYSGIESVPGPELPKVEFLNRFNEENQKRYAENDARFKDSPVLKELLERSKLNKEKNRQAIQDKYCIRGAEWGVGDCSTEGMTPDERETFIAALKKKAGVE